MGESAYKTASGEIEILFYVDDDDSPPLLTSEYVSEPYIYLGKREGVGKAWNKLAEVSQGSILFLCNDDLRFDSYGWDADVTDAMDDCLVYCNDGLKYESHAAFPFIPRDWYEKLGYFVPEHFGFFYHDTWLFDLANRVGKVKYLEDTHITHWHNMSDDTAREARQRAGKDPQIWIDTEPQRIEDAKKL